MPIAAGLRFYAKLPEDFKANIVLAQIRNQQRAQMKDMLKQAEAVTSRWKHKVAWRSWYRAESTSQEIMVWTTDEIFGYLDNGTKKHFIKPKNKKVLHWHEGGDEKNGEARFSKGHWVSGIVARDYMKNIRDNFAKQYAASMQDAIDEGFKVQGYRVGTGTPGRIR
jgi:hypothetical protein